MKTSICLCMIVRNEEAVIKRCLESVREFVDTWVIVDTGSTDKTKEIVRETLAGIEGELFDSPWFDFAYNRNEALQLASGKADYIFRIDADEVLETPEGFEWPLLEKDLYNLRIKLGDIVYLRPALLKDGVPFEYKGAVHEFLDCPLPFTSDILGGLSVRAIQDSARNLDPQKYRRDALLLERALIDDPGNSRNVFYAAQSWRDAGEFDRALARYADRIRLGGWIEEVWFSYYSIARIKAARGDPWPEVLAAYLAAYEANPVRFEPLYRIGLYYSVRREFATALLFLKIAVYLVNPPPDALFVEMEAWRFLLPIEYAVVCHYTGNHFEARKANEAVLRKENLPEHLRSLVEANLSFALPQT